MAHRLLICGTGTNVGKTHVTRALVHALRAQDRSCCAVKPIEAREEAGPADYELIAAGADPITPLLLLPEPLSPHLAARRAGVAIELTRLTMWVGEQTAGCEWSLIETAGGVFSPLTVEATNFELLQLLEPTAIIAVAPDRIGCFHDLIACLRAAGDTLATSFVALSAAPPSDASTGLNGPELGPLGYSRPVWVFPPGDPADAASRAVADSLIAAILAEAEAR